MQRRKKSTTEKNTLPSNIFWKNEKDVEALTNNHLKMYLKQHGLKISGSKAELRWLVPVFSFLTVCNFERI